MTYLPDHVAIDEIANVFTDAKRDESIRDAKHAAAKQARFVDGREYLKPICAPCSLRRAVVRQEPSVVSVDRCLIMREAIGRGYLLVLYCHGASLVIELGHDTPTDRTIQTMKVFDASQATTK